MYRSRSRLHLPAPWPPPAPTSGAAPFRASSRTVCDFARAIAGLGKSNKSISFFPLLGHGHCTGGVVAGGLSRLVEAAPIRRELLPGKLLQLGGYFDVDEQ